MCMSGGVVRKNSSQATASDPSTGTLRDARERDRQRRHRPGGEGDRRDPERERHAQEQAGNVTDDGVQAKHRGWLERRSVRSVLES